MTSLVRWVGRAIGLDVHREFCVVAICEDGKVRSGGRVPSTPEGLRLLAESLLPSDRVALEVTASCWEVARILEPFVDRVIVVSPDDTGIASARAKTDKLDARALAGLCWKGELEAVWMPDQRCQILRRRLARRTQLVHARSRAKNEISAVLQRRLVERPPFADLFGVRSRRWLSEVELPLQERESVDAGLRQIVFLDGEIKAVEKLIAQQALSWPEIRRLMTVPGREPDLRRDVHRRDRAGGPVPNTAQAGRVPRAGPEDPSIRRGAGALGPDLQARIGLSAVGAGRSGVERGQATRAAARVLRACPRAPWAREGDRRDRPEARDPVLVHAQTLRGLRAPAARADQEEAPRARADRRCQAAHKGRRRDLVNDRAIRDAERALTEQAEISYKRIVTDQQAGRPARKWARARHRSAHKSGPQRGNSCAADSKLLTSALRYVSHPRPPTT